MAEVGPVLVVGAGLLGTSVGLALSRAGEEVWLDDIASEHVRTASGLGAGLRVTADARPRVVVVAVPPDHLWEAILTALRRYPEAVVTDVGSVKAGPLATLRASGATTDELARYVGGHPMAGSERNGPLAASETMFEGRPWAISAHPDADPDHVRLVAALAARCGATVVHLEPEEHDQAVARISHLPHLMSVLMAARLQDAPETHLALSGQGVRDVTRVAGSDPRLWQQIISGNAPAITALLRQVRDDLDGLLDAVDAQDRSGTGDLLGRGVAGARSVPAKHGGPDRALASVFVTLADSPGELARIFSAVGTVGVNVEDMRIDHEQSRAGGVLELVVAADRVDGLVDHLESIGWSVHR